MNIEDFEKSVEQAADDQNLEELERLGTFFHLDKNLSGEFEPCLVFKDPNVDGFLPPIAGKFVLATANKWARRHRDAVYNRKLGEGYDGIRIVDEGDSWFQYPVLNHFVSDTIDVLLEPYLIKSISEGGATLDGIIERNLYPSIIKNTNAQVFLFSASGNDILGQGNLKKLLHPYQTDMSVDDIFNEESVETVLEGIKAQYNTVITKAKEAQPDVHIAFHGYDAPVPRDKGKALGRPLRELGVPEEMQYPVVKILVNALNECLSKIAAGHANTTHIDCRGLVGDTKDAWLFDEIHPKNEGYGKIAAKFNKFIHSVDLK